MRDKVFFEKSDLEQEAKKYLAAWGVDVEEDGVFEKLVGPFIRVFETLFESANERVCSFFSEYPLLIPSDTSTPEQSESYAQEVDANGFKDKMWRIRYTILSTFITEIFRGCVQNTAGFFSEAINSSISSPFGVINPKEIDGFSEKLKSEILKVIEKIESSDRMKIMFCEKAIFSLANQSLDMTFFEAIGFVKFAVVDRIDDTAN